MTAQSQVPCLVFDELLEQFTRAAYQKTCRQARVDSDDFRAMGLDRYVADSQHHIGMYFATLLARGWIEKVGEWRRSAIDHNHRREIRVFRWTGEAGRALGGESE